MILYLLKVHLQTFLSIPVTQKCQILSCDILVANEQYHLSGSPPVSVTHIEQYQSIIAELPTNFHRLAVVSQVVSCARRSSLSLCLSPSLEQEKRPKINGYYDPLSSSICVCLKFVEKKKTSSVYDCTVEDVEYICNSNSTLCLFFFFCN